MLRLVLPRSLSRLRCSSRYLGTNADSQESKKNELSKVMDEHEDVPEEEFSVSLFNQNQLLPEVPITSLDIVKRIEKISKKGSFCADIFTGNYDHDFLTYPEPLDNRIENQKLKDQAKMIQQLWPVIWDDELQLQKFNFFNLFQLSVSEMMTVYEAIGASSKKCYDNNLIFTQKGSQDMLQQQILVTRAIISLITRNCLTYWPMSRSKNEKIQEFLPKKHILFGGLSDSKELQSPIGFCWTEHAPELGSLPPQEWLTFGQAGGQGIDHHVIKGLKTRVLADESTQHYLLYFRDKFLSDKYEKEVPEDESNPASDPLVGCCIVHKSEVKESPTYIDQVGFTYRDIEIDTIVPDSRLVFSAGRNDPTGVNIKALGQVATSAVILGLLKDILRSAYTVLIERKRGILNCDVVERKLTEVTSRIFAIESMVYYIAGMYDGLEDGFDAHMEATILKIVSNEYAQECIQIIQQVCGSDMFITSKIQDQINILDSFLDGNIYNRLYLATMGILWYARSQNMHLNKLRLAPWYPGYFLKTMIKETSERGDFLTLEADIYGHLHPSLYDAAANLEYIVKRVKYATEAMCRKHGKDATAAQSDLYRLAQLSIDSFMLTTILARASKSWCNGSRNADIDLNLAGIFSHTLKRKVMIYMTDIQTSPIETIDSQSSRVNLLNMKLGGYYAESPLDPNV